MNNDVMKIIKTMTITTRIQIVRVGFFFMLLCTELTGDTIIHFLSEDEVSRLMIAASSRKETGLA